MPAGGQLAAERNGGKGVTRVAERGEQDAAALRLAQSISASWRTMRLRCSGSKAIVEVSSVPTPASR